MKLEGSRILVTGGTGFIGSHVIDQLIAERPKEIIAFDKNLSCVEQSRSSELDYRNVRFLEGDITRASDVKEALKEVDFVIHTASLLTREAAENLRTALEVNICGTFNLLEMSMNSAVEKIIYSSSVSAYGDPLFIPMTEEHPFNTNSMYGAGKVSCELLLRVCKKMKGFNYVALRYASVYGPRHHYRGGVNRYIPECFDRIEQGLPPIIYGNGSQSHEFVYVGDVARANILALKSLVTGESINIGTGILTTMKDIVRMIIEITGACLEPLYIPHENPFEMKGFFLDVTKAEKTLGFRTEVPMEEGLRRYYDWRKKMRGSQQL